jgi:hypothetical protein
VIKAAGVSGASPNKGPPRKDPETVVERTALERRRGDELHGPRVSPTEAENGVKRDAPVEPVVNPGVKRTP